MSERLLEHHLLLRVVDFPVEKTLSVDNQTIRRRHTGFALTCQEEG